MTWTTRPRSDLSGLAAITKGEGPLVVMIHGVGLRSEAWNGQIDALCERFRVVAIDMPGHGESPVPTNEFKLPSYTDAIAAVIDEPALVVGHSMGGMIALDLAHRYPDKVQGVAALNAVFERHPEATKAVRARAAGLDGVTVSDPSATLKRWFGEAPSPERSACQDWLTSVSPRGYKMAYTAFAHNDDPTQTSLAALNCPSLFMTGADEPNSTPEMSIAMASLAQNGSAIVVEGAAHMMPMTHRDEVNAALLEFAGQVFQ